MEKFYRIDLRSHGAGESEVHAAGQESGNSHRVPMLQPRGRNVLWVEFCF